MNHDLKGHKLCKQCGQPILNKGQARKNDWEYRHASGCPLDDFTALGQAEREIHMEANLKPGEVTYKNDRGELRVGRV